MKIAVVIPCYNCRKYLTNAVRSVFEQRFTSVEVILVDDGSTDGTSALCDQIAEDHDKVTVIHIENCGVAGARNQGIEFIFSKGISDDLYIAFLDADDAWKAYSVNDVITLPEHHYDCICLQSLYCNGSLTRYAEPSVLKEGDYTGGPQLIQEYRGHSFGAVLYSAAFLQSRNIRFQPMNYSEDRIFLMQCLCLAEHVCFRNVPFYLYRNNRSSAMHSRNYGISYFDPIVRGYLKMNDLSCNPSESVKLSAVGRSYARTYLIDMVQEHYNYGGTKQELDDYFEKNQDLRELLNNRGVGGVNVNRKFDQLSQINESGRYLRRIGSFIYRKMKRPAAFIHSALFDGRKYPNQLHEER